MKNNLLFILFLFTINICAQTQLRGVVMDESSIPLATVSVVAYNVESDDVLGYSITNEKGEYTIPVKCELDSVRLEISIMGFEFVEVMASDVSFPYNVKLRETDIELKEVVVEGVPIRVTGDTITYDVNAIKNENDVTVEDIIKNIPGIKVSDNGTIEYQGEPINKFYIEGMDLLAGRYSLATRNITADNIASVSVYENHQPKQVLKDVVFSKQAALNIKLKKNSMLHPVGNVGLSSGYGDEWLKGGNLALLLVHPDFQSLNTAKYSDYAGSYGNETSQMYDEYGVNSSTTASEVGKPRMKELNVPNELFNRNDAWSATSSNIIRVGKDKTFNILGGYTADDINNEVDNKISYWCDNDVNIEIVENNKTNFKNEKGWLQTKYENNSSACYVLNDFSANGVFVKENRDVMSRDVIDQIGKMSDYKLNNVTDLIYKKNRNIIRYNSLLSYINTPKCSLTADRNDTTILSQSMDGSLFKVFQELAYSKGFTANTSFYSKLNFMGCSDNLYLNRWNATAPEESNLNGCNLRTSLLLGFSHKFPKICFIRVNIPITMYNVLYNGNTNSESFSKVVPLIDVSATFNFYNGLKAQLGYSRNYSVGGMTDYLIHPVYTSYREETIYGVGKVVEKRGHTISSVLTYSNYVNGLSGTLMISQMWNKRNYMSAIDVTDDMVSNSYTKSDNNTSMFNGNLMLSKKYYDTGTAISLDLSLNITNQNVLRHSIVNRISSTLGVIGVGIKQTLFENKIVAAANYRYEPTMQSMKSINMDCHGSNTSVSTSLSFFPIKPLEISVEPEYKYDAPYGEMENKNLYLNSYVRYTSKKFVYQLMANNLTNRRTYISENFSSGDVYSYVYRLKPVQIVLSVKFSIR